MIETTIRKIPISVIIGIEGGCAGGGTVSWTGRFRPVVRARGAVKCGISQAAGFATPNDAGEWQGFDPTNNIEIGDRHVLVGRGRDYGDVPPLRGVYAGPFKSHLHVKVTITREA